MFTADDVLLMVMSYTPVFLFKFQIRYNPSILKHKNHSNNGF